MTEENDDNQNRYNSKLYFYKKRKQAVGISIVAAAIVALAFTLGSFPNLQTSVSAQEGPPMTNGSESGEGAPEEEFAPPLTAQAVDMNASKVIVSGTAASPGDEAGPFQIVTVLPERTDGKIYSGTISFTATAPVYVIPGFGFDAQNNTLNHADYGELIRFPSEASFANVTTAAPEIAHGPILPEYSPQPDSDIGPLPKTYTATVPFIGDVLELGNVNGTKFLVSYNVIADVYETTRIADITPAIMNRTAGESEDNSVSIVYGAVEMTDGAFSPNPIVIQSGENVTWTNNDFLPHTVTSGTPDQMGTDQVGEEFDSGFLGTRTSYTHTFDDRGEFDYFCQIHPNMVGKVSVK